MVYIRDGARSEKGPLSERDRRALATLERSVQTSRVRALWNRVRFRLTTRWGPRLAITVGTLLTSVALVVMLAELNTDLTIALSGEVVLTAGTLLVAHGVRLWWNWRQAKQAASLL